MVKDYDEKINELKKELLRLNHIETLLDDLDLEIIDFLYQSLKEKKGYIFVYHQSDYLQTYDFHVKPQILLSIEQYEKLKDIFVFEVNYKMIPLLLSDGHFYQKLKKISSLDVELPLVSSEEDVEKLVRLCRKENHRNIWIMHSNNQPLLNDYLKKVIDDNDIVMTIDDELVFEKDTDYHVVLMLMTKGNHYHELLKRIPSYASVSEILPLQQDIIKWIEMRINHY